MADVVCLSDVYKPKPKKLDLSFQNVIFRLNDTVLYIQ